MNQIDTSPDSVTMADHLVAIGRRRWWVVVFAIAGALAGILGLRSSVSDQHVVAVAVPYKWTTDPTTLTLQEIVRPSDEAKAATDRREELVPELHNANLSVEGQDDSHRLVFTASAATRQNATDLATKFAKAFTAARLTVLDGHLDEEITLEADSLAQLETRLKLNGSDAQSTVEDAAVTLEIIDRSRRLAFLTHLRGPAPMIGEPEVVRSVTTPLGATSILLPILGVLLGGLLGATLAASAGRLDRRLYSRSDLERTIEGVPVLAVADDSGDVAAYLPAAGSLIGQFGRPDTVIGIASAGSDVLATVATEALQRGLELIAPSSNATVPTVRAIATSLTDDSTGLLDARDLDAVIVMSHSGKTRDTQLVEAVSSLNLIGAKVVGLMLVGVPLRELEAARISTWR